VGRERRRGSDPPLLERRWLFGDFLIAIKYLNFYLSRRVMTVSMHPAGTLRPPPNRQPTNNQSPAGRGWETK